MKLTKTQKIILAICIVPLCMLMSIVIDVLHEFPREISNQPIEEHQKLFAKKNNDKLKLLRTIKSSNNIESVYVYNQKYDLFIYSVNIKTDQELKNTITYQNEDSYFNGNYTKLRSSNFEMRFKIKRADRVSKINFKSKGGAIKTFKESKHLYFYSYTFNNFSIAFDNATYDIFAMANNNAVPANVAFIKKGKVVYIILLSLIKANDVMDPDILYDIIDPSLK